MNPVLKKLKQGEVSLGGWMQINSPDIAEILSHAGLDWVAVDMEHGAFDITDLNAINRGIERHGAVPFARLSRVNYHLIKQVLDSGTRGLILPMVKSAEDIHEAVSGAFYPPIGQRGIGYCRANAFGMDFEKYLAEANEDIMVVAQIEDIAAIDAIDEIFSIPQVSSFIVGPYDLTGSMGIVGQFTHPDFEAAVQRVMDAGKAHGVVPGMHVVAPDADEVKGRLAQGFQFVAVSVDAYMLATQTNKLLSSIKD